MFKHPVDPTRCSAFELILMDEDEEREEAGEARTAGGEAGGEAVESA